MLEIEILDACGSCIVILGHALRIDSRQSCKWIGFRADLFTFVSNDLISALKVSIVCGGSYRRGKASCGDLDIIITHPDGKRLIEFAPYFQSQRILPRYVKHLKDMKFLREDLIFSTHSEEGTDSGVDTYFGLCTYPARELRHRIDLKVYPRNIYAFGLISWTGNDVLNRRLRILAESKGYRLDDTGLFLATQGSGGKREPLQCACMAPIGILVQARLDTFGRKGGSHAKMYLGNPATIVAMAVRGLSYPCKPHEDALITGLAVANHEIQNILDNLRSCITRPSNRCDYVKPKMTSDSSSASTTNAQNPLAQSNTHPPPIALPTNTSSFSFASMNQPLMVKLDSWNYLVWKNQLQNVIIANGLDNFIYGSCPCLARFLDVATNHQSEVLGLATIQATSNELVVCLPI
ncbi:DNA polymerase lambda [Vitis vinifera]|uniref:DNA polymerase n=1 Tax=Vitis vinifera TaxID=29760 RepID=A0A438JNX1_VITVI|nr:DNA polymerase lambda [Vitis vinifera]